jgi:hypothetical protein
MEKKKNVSIFDSAKSKPKATSSAKDKEVVTVRGLETTLLEFQFLKEQIADDEAKLAAVTDEIKQISKEKFVELYKQKKTNPNSFYIKDGSGCVMVIPTDRYISIKEEDRADELIEKYGDEAVTIDEKYYFNPEVLERNMAAIEKLIKDAKTISDADKQDLLIREVKYSISKGFIDRLLPYGNEMENVIDDVQPIITLKNCGGKMADGGVSDEGEFIANVYDDYDAEVGTTVSSMYAEGGQVNYEPINFPTRNQTEESAKKFLNELIREKGRIEAAKITMRKILPSLLAPTLPNIKENSVYNNWLKSAIYTEIYNQKKYEYADGGIISEYENILISNGFKKENYRNTYGSNVYYTKGDITANINVDEVSLFNGDGRMHYFGYFKQQPFANMQDFVEKLEYLEDFDKYADGGMTSRYEIEQEKDGTWMILDKQRGMYIDRWFETKKEAENYLFYKKREDNYPLPLTDFDRRIIDYAKGLPNNDNQDEKFYMSKGGFFGDSRYNTGLSWHLDHARHNKKESYEKPLKYRKRRRI